MQNGVRPVGLVESLECCRNSGIMNRQKGAVELDTKARKSRFVVVERMDKQRRGIFADARKTPKPGNEDT